MSSGVDFKRTQSQDVLDIRPNYSYSAKSNAISKDVDVTKVAMGAFEQRRDAIP
jgi:hypothetical protein